MEPNAACTSQYISTPPLIRLLYWSMRHAVSLPSLVTYVSMCVYVLLLNCHLVQIIQHWSDHGDHWCINWTGMHVGSNTKILCVHISKMFYC